MSQDIQKQVIETSRALGGAISTHVKAVRLDEAGRPVKRANQIADASYRRFLTRRNQLISNMIQKAA